MSSSEISSTTNLGLTVKASLLLMFASTMWKALLCMFLGCIIPLLGGLGTFEGGLELSHGPGHVVPRYA